MTAHRRLERTLILCLAPVFALCFLLSVRTAFTPGGYAPVVVSGARQPADHPVLAAIRPYSEAGGLEVGDRLVRVGPFDLRDASSIEFLAAFAAAARSDPSEVRVEYQRGDEIAEARLTPVGHGFLKPLVLTGLAFAICAFVLVLRSRPLPMTRAFVFAFLALAFFLCSNFFGSSAEFVAAAWLQLVSLSVAGPLFVRAFRMFPHGVSPRGWWVASWPWTFAAVGPLHMARFGLGVPYALGARGAGMLVALELVILLLVLMRNYRHPATDGHGRRILREFGFGVYCALLPPIFCSLLGTFDVRFTPIYQWSLVALAVVPIALLISIRNRNPFDIDPLIAYSGSTSLLTLIGIGLWVLAAPRISVAASRYVGIDPNVGEMLLLVVLLGTLFPVHRKARGLLESVLLAERRSVDLHAEQLRKELGSCPDWTALVNCLGAGVHGLMRSETCVLYARIGATYGPLYVEGRAIPPAFDADGPLDRVLVLRDEPLGFGSSGRRGDPELAPFDRAILETLDAAVVVPIRRGGELRLVLCLGRKLSGDVYTPADLSLLAKLSDRASMRLLEFDKEELTRESLKAQESLRRYVPGALAGELERGQEPGQAEREVSVMFADLRAYSTYAQQHSPHEVFKTLDVYTESVSRVIREHGGHLVDFGGDGLMAAFGAREDLPGKEQKAVEAGREIVRLVESLAPGGIGNVGVGISTGHAYVGSIRSVDRLIWSVVGDTTNLAKRLQDLTRDLDAEIAVDATTWSRSGPAVRDFVECRGVPIRGRAGTVDVFVRPSERA